MAFARDGVALVVNNFAGYHGLLDNKDWGDGVVDGGVEVCGGGGKVVGGEYDNYIGFPLEASSVDSAGGVVEHALCFRGVSANYEYVVRPIEMAGFPSA